MSRKQRAVIIGACIVAVVVIVIAAVMARSDEGPPTPPPPPPPTGPVSHNVSWPIDETTVYATITRPQGDGPYPAVVLVAGTGSFDRDWNALHLPGTNGSGRLLAVSLARQGFVTIRHDKRYVGPGAEENIPHLLGRISLASHLEEIAGAVEMLLAQPYVDPERIYLLSHGEGALHALNYHLQHGEPIAGLVLTGPPGRSMADLFVEQINRQFEGLPGGEKIVPGLEELIADFLAGDPFEPHPDVPIALNDMVSTWHDPRNLPFMREILPLDPADLLPQATVPALVVIGGKDIQVDWQVDGALLQAATEGLDHIAYRFPANANRVLKFEPKPREQLSEADVFDYNAEGRVLDPETVLVIVNWLNEQSKAG